MSFTELVNIDRIKDIFLYQEKAPLVFSSGIFLLLFTGFFGVYILLHNRQTLRLAFTVLFSVFFYYKSSGFYFWILLVSCFVDYHLGNIIYREQRKAPRRLLLIISLIMNLGTLFYFKYTNFGIANWNGFFGTDYKLLDIFLPVGISFYTFQSLSYTIDVYRRELKPAKSLLDFAFFVSFFPQLVAGPIVRASDFIPQIYNKIQLSKKDLSRAWFLICGGLIKKVLISDYLSVNFVDRVFDNPLLYTSYENWVAVYAYAMQIYCDFSGYSDMAIGIALLLGFRLPDNFNSPYQSTSITEFWRRWHISLSTWLRDYLYIPLGGSRKGPVRTYVNLMLTMLIGGLWHGANWKFVIWGGIHGAVLSIEKLLFRFFPLSENIFRKIIGWFITFHVVCFAWIFFRAYSFEQAMLIINQMGQAFPPISLWEMVYSYRIILAVLALAFVLHFIPPSRETRFILFFEKWPLVLKALYVSASIWIVIQVAQADVQPFIYFQF